MKIRIVSVTDYVRETRDVRVGDEYEVINSGFSSNPSRENCYLFLSKNNKPSLMYEHEVRVIK